MPTSAARRQIDDMDRRCRTRADAVMTQQQANDALEALGRPGDDTDTVALATTLCDAMHAAKPQWAGMSPALYQWWVATLVEFVGHPRVGRDVLDAIVRTTCQLSVLREVVAHDAFDRTVLLAMLTTRRRSIEAWATVRGAVAHHPVGSLAVTLVDRGLAPRSAVAAAVRLADRPQAADTATVLLDDFTGTGVELADTALALT